LLRRTIFFGRMTAVGQKGTKNHVRCRGSFRRKRPWRLAGPPMTLGNMRANGVRSLDVSCWQCHQRAIFGGPITSGAEAVATPFSNTQPDW
jgi:hypothetical protein